jgi:ParB/RepB/Spo0J family partition protein
MDQSQPRKSAPNLRIVNPFECRIWVGHTRLPELITEESCREEIASFLQHGQKQPVLVRPIRGESQFKFELIYGARRLFVAQHLNAGLLVDVRDIDDRQAFIEMDIENRLRKEISPYERGMAYKDWLRHGYFASQKDIAAALGVSSAQVSRLLRFAELPAVVVRAFGSQANMKEAWAIALAERCKDPAVKQKITAVARALESGGEHREPSETFKLLLDCEDSRRRARLSRNDTVVRSADGNALFRISYRSNDVHIVVPRERAGSEAIAGLARVLKDFIEADVAMKAPRTARPRTTQPEQRQLRGRARLSLTDDRQGGGAVHVV